MRRTRFNDRLHVHGGTVLSMLLVATLVAPLPAGAWGARLPTAFGIGRGALLLAALTLAVAYIASRSRRTHGEGARSALVVVLLTGGLAAVLGRFIDLRASAFYTEQALFEGVALLLAVHLVAEGLGMVGRRKVLVPVRAVALLVATAWVLTAFNARDAAFAVMLAAGASALLVPLLRLPDALRAAPRSRVPAIALAVILLFGCAPSSRAHGDPLERFASTSAGPGCGVQVAGRVPPPASVPASILAVRASAASSAALSLRLNIPAYRLDVVSDSAVVASYEVAVGTRKYRTPVGAFAVHRIVWNPWWVPPKSFWARKDTVTPPGPTNPMGRVKLLLGGPYFLHGTPFAASIGSAASHGCIRMRNEDAIALARRLQADGGAGPDDEDLLHMLADTVSLVVDLPAPVPVEIGYSVAEVREDVLLLHPDVYGRVAGRTRDAAMLALLGAGRDTAAVRRRVLTSAVRRSRSRHVAIPLDSLLTGIMPVTSTNVRIP